MDLIEQGKKIADIRRRKGMTQEELAERASINVRTIQRIESGEVDSRLYTITVIANALEVEEHGRLVLNFQLSVFFMLMISGFLSIVLIGIIFAPIITIFTWIITTINIARFVGGHPVRYPLSMKIMR